MGLAASKQEAFWEACGFGHPETVRMFIDQGIDVNWVSYTHNCCPIHVASQGKKEIVQMLLDAKCDVNAKDDRGNLAIHHAAMRGHTEIMKMLMGAGSPVNTPDKNGWTALINAAYWCQPGAVRLLIDRQCDVTYQNKDDRTALHEACRSQSDDEDGLAQISEMLVKAGCSLNAKSSDLGDADFTPLMFTAYHNHPGVARVLVECGCDVNAQGTNGWSALHWAADRGNREIVEILIDAGIDPLLEAPRGKLALHCARDNEIKESLDQAVRSARGACETDEDILDGSDYDDDDGYEKRDSVKTPGDEATENDISSLPSSPVSSIPDAMDKDNSSEKGIPAINGHDDHLMNGINRMTKNISLTDAEREVLNKYKNETFDEDIDANDFKDSLN